MTMNDINCPHCGKAFKIDESGYADIIKQVRNAEFEHEMHERLDRAEREKHSALELAQEKAANELQKVAAEKSIEIQQLKAQLQSAEIAQKLAINEALSDARRECDSLQNHVDRMQFEK